jgi:HEAT repeat protein
MEIKNIIIIIIFAIVILVISYLGLPIGWSFYQAIFNPLGNLEIDRQYRNLSSEDLIKKLTPIHPLGATPSCAMQILAERREQLAVPKIIKLINSVNPDNRYQAIRALGNIGDERGIEPLLKIINKGDNKNNPNYHAALYSLCQIGYKPIHPIVLEMLKRPDGARNGSTAMMEYIGADADILVLEDMLNKIRGNDVNARLDRSGIKKAIEAIKKREGIIKAKSDMTKKVE